MRPRGPQDSASVLVGDYFQVTTDRPPVYGRAVDEGFARVERIERVPAEVTPRVLDSAYVDGLSLAVMWCHGVPGPVVVSSGDVCVLDWASERRAHHDRQHLWWPPVRSSLFPGGVPAGEKPPRRRRIPEPLRQPVEWAAPSSTPKAPVRATGFTKPASALRIGDYLCVHADRWPASDHDIDEGFARVEHLRYLDEHAARDVFADPAWHTQAIAVSVYGLSGILLVTARQEVTVQALVNPERQILEQRSLWTPDPSLELAASRPPTDAECAAADRLDQATRPQVDEADWYPSQFDDPDYRRLTIEGIHGWRTVPLSALPWPHHQTDCGFYRIVQAEARSVPNRQAAHAAAFLSDEARPVMARCPYHQPDWPRLVRILRQSRDGLEDDERPAFRTHPEYDQLTDDEQRWLHIMVVEPIEWDDGGDQLINGQHRSCALRAAGVEHCPVKGRFLPGTQYPASTNAAEHARATVKDSWRDHAAEHDVSGWAGTLARLLPRAWRARLIEDDH